jgi:hypothetical protein
MTPKEWRSKHKRCRLCRYARSPVWLGICGEGSDSQWLCKAKAKLVFPNLLRFCKVFEAKEEHNEAD